MSPSKILQPHEYSEARKLALNELRIKGLKKIKQTCLDEYIRTK